MKKRIFSTLMIISAAVALFACVTVSYSYYAFYHRQAVGAIESTARLCAASFEGELTQERFDELAGRIDDADRQYPLRITLIAPDGLVLFDNREDAALLENHAGRTEVTEALRTGFGESERYSSTAQCSIYYYAVRLQNGSVLRLSRSLESIYTVFSTSLANVLWILALAAVLSLFLAEQLSRAVVRPINRLSGELDQFLARGEAPVYDELEPFACRLRELAQSNHDVMSQLQTEKETIDAIVQNMQEGFILLDGREDIVTLNSSARRILNPGFTSSGQRTNLLQFSRSPALLAVMEEARREGHASRDAQLPEESGRIYRILVNSMRQEQNVTGFIVMMLDITAEAQSEQIRREFAANVSHELRTPLTTVSGFAELMAGGMVSAPEDVKKYAGMIEQESKRLIRLIEDIMRLSQIESSEAEHPDPEPVPLMETARETIALLQEAARQKQVTLSLEGEALTVPGNPGYLRELLLNLIDNAIKYNRPGGTVQVALHREEGRAVLTVADSGIGIPKESQPRVFERFYRVDKSRSKEIGGTGLGLSIVKHIVEFHHGSLSLESDEGQGTRMTVSLPL